MPREEYFVVLRFPCPPPQGHESTAHAFYETEHVLVAEELKRLFTADSETISMSGVFGDPGDCAPPVYEVRSAELSVTERVLFQKQIKKDVGFSASRTGVDARTAFLMRCHARAHELEPLIRDELADDICPPQRLPRPPKPPAAPPPAPTRSKAGGIMDKPKPSALPEQSDLEVIRAFIGALDAFAVNDRAHRQFTERYCPGPPGMAGVIRDIIPAAFFDQNRRFHQQGAALSNAVAERLPEMMKLAARYGVGGGVFGVLAAYKTEDIAHARATAFQIADACAAALGGAEDAPDAPAKGQPAQVETAPSGDKETAAPQSPSAPEQHQENLLTDLLASENEQGAIERNRVSAWLQEDCPDYDERIRTLKADPRWPMLAAKWEANPSCEGNQEVLGELCRLRDVYKVPTEPKINSPERLLWWLEGHRNPLIENASKSMVSGGKYGYLSEVNPVVREFSLAIRSGNPRLPSLPVQQADPLSEWQSLFNWCLDAKGAAGLSQNSGERAGIVAQDAHEAKPAANEAGSAPTVVRIENTHEIAKAVVDDIRGAGLLQPSGPSDRDAVDRLPKRLRLAYRQWEVADRELGGGKSDDDCYAKVKQGHDAQNDSPLPGLETWKRYVRESRTKLGKQKNTPRAGREHRGAVAVPGKNVDWKDVEQVAGGRLGLRPDTDRTPS